jgi:hypothetical protein
MGQWRRLAATQIRYRTGRRGGEWVRIDVTVGGRFGSLTADSCWCRYCIARARRHRDEQSQFSVGDVRAPNDGVVQKEPQRDGRFRDSMSAQGFPPLQQTGGCPGS